MESIEIFEVTAAVLIGVGALVWTAICGVMAVWMMIDGDFLDCCFPAVLAALGILALAAVADYFIDWSLCSCA